MKHPFRNFLALKMGALLLPALLLWSGPAQGQPFVPQGGEFQISTYTLDYQSFARVEKAPDGSFAVVWHGGTVADPSRGINGRLFSSMGAALGAEFQVNVLTAYAQLNPDISSQSSSGFVVVWTNYNTPRAVYGRRISNLGQPLGGEFLIPESTLVGSYKARVGADALGNFVVVWNDAALDSSSESIAARRFSSAGVPVGTPFLVNTYTTGPQTNPDISVAPDGSFLIVWTTFDQDGSNTGIAGQHFSNSGAPFGTEFTVNTSTLGFQNFPSVANGGGRFAVVWSGSDFTDYDVYGQMFSGLGAFIGGEFQINTYTSDQQTQPEIAFSGSGGFVVTWDSYGQNGRARGLYPGVFGQRFSSTGAVQGTEFLVNTYTTNGQANSAVAMEGDDAVVVWTDFHYSDGRVIGQKFGPPLPTATSTATPTPTFTSTPTATETPTPTPTLPPPTYPIPGSAEVSVNVFTTGEQDCPVVAVDGQGNFLMAWEGMSPLDSSGIGGRSFDSQGQPTSGDLQLNQLLTMSQSDPRVAGFADGGFVVIWSQPDADMTAGMGGRLFASNGSPVGADFQVNAYTTGQQGIGSVASTDAGDFLVAWPDDSQGYPTRLRMRRFNRSATPVAGEQTLATAANTNRALLPKLAIAPDESFVMTWTEQSLEPNAPGYFVKGQRFTSAALPQGTAFELTQAAGQAFLADVGNADDGSFVVTWEQGLAYGASIQGIWAQRFASDGSLQGTNFQVNELSPGLGDVPKIQVFPDSSFIVAWMNTTKTREPGRGTELGPHARRYGSDGVPLEDEFRVNLQPVTNSDEVVVSGRSLNDFVVAWSTQNEDDIHAVFFTGTPPPTSTPEPPTPTPTPTNGGATPTPLLPGNGASQTVRVTLPPGQPVSLKVNVPPNTQSFGGSTVLLKVRGACDVTVSLFDPGGNMILDDVDLQDLVDFDVPNPPPGLWDLQLESTEQCPELQVDVTVQATRSVPAGSMTWPILLLLGLGWLFLVPSRKSLAPTR